MGSHDGNAPSLRRMGSAEIEAEWARDNSNRTNIGTSGAKATPWFNRQNDTEQKDKEQKENMNEKKPCRCRVWGYDNMVHRDRDSSNAEKGATEPHRRYLRVTIVLSIDEIELPDS